MADWRKVLTPAAMIEGEAFFDRYGLRSSR